MKQILFCIVLAAGIAAATGCSDNSVKPSGDGRQFGDSISGNCNQDTVSKVLCLLDSAQLDISLFDSLSKTYLKDSSTPIRAYTVRAVDLLDALGLPPGLADSCKYRYIRAYLGYRQGTGFKLYIVPVTDACLRDSIGGTDVVLNNAGRAALPGEPEYVLDLNAPCPRTCPTNGIMKNE